ncbi:MAG: DMP19 family protein [Acidovorax sp.]
MAYLQHFIRPATGHQPCAQLRMGVQGNSVHTAELQPAPGVAADSPGAAWKALRTKKCRNAFEAAMHANGQEWDWLSKGWQLACAAGVPLHAGTTADGGQAHLPDLRPVNPGPLSVLAKDLDFDWSSYFEYAVCRIAEVWEWDKPERAAELRARMAPAQMALWAIANADGQICNGGFSQFFYNSYGELAHEALAGFELLGLVQFADILRDAYAVFPGQRIPKDRDERVAILEALTPDDASASPRLQAASNRLEHASAIFKGTEDLWDELETRYYALIHQDIGVRGYNAAFYKPLCECIEAHSHEVFR